MHLVFNGPNNKLKAYNSNGSCVFQAEARNATVSTLDYGPQYYGHWGACPPGEYALGKVMPLDPPEVPYGRFYVPVLDINGLWARYGRDGIGIHGGGSGLPDSFAPFQGWMITEGCIRLQNDNLAKLVTLLNHDASNILTVFQGVAN